MVLGSVFGMVLETTQGAEVGAIGSGDGKDEGSFAGEIMLLNNSSVCFDGRGD